MDQIILYRGTGRRRRERTVFPNFELFPYFNIDIQRAGKQQFQQRKRIVNFVEEMQMTINSLN